MKNFKNLLKFSYEFYLDNNIIYENELIEEILYTKNSKYIPIPLFSESFDKLNIKIVYGDKLRSEEIYFENRIKYEYHMEFIIEPMKYILDNEEYIHYSSLDWLEKIDFLRIALLVLTNKKSYTGYHNGHIKYTGCILKLL